MTGLQTHEIQTLFLMSNRKTKYNRILNYSSMYYALLLKDYAFVGVLSNVLPWYGWLFSERSLAYS
jgi:hypothetical protein